MNNASFGELTVKEIEECALRVFARAWQAGEEVRDE